MRTPPHSPEAESALLGAALVSGDAARGIASELNADDFYSLANRRIFEAISELVGEGSEVDVITTRDKLNNDKDRLVLLDLDCPLSSVWRDYANIVKNDGAMRRFIALCSDGMAKAYDNGDAAQVIGETVGELLASLDTGRTSDSLAALVEKRLEDYRSPTPYLVAIGSGVKLHFGDLTIMAGRPGSGKTAYAIANADAWSQRYKVAFYTFEMTADELCDRFVSRETHLPTESTFDGLTEGEALLYRKQVEPLKSRKLSIKECSGLTENQLAASLKAAAASGVRVAIIDYLQIAYEHSRSGENADLTRLSKMLRRTAKSTGLAIVALSQFSRDGDQEDDKRIVYPRSKHLRGSGSLEQDAANICLMYAYPPPDSKLGKEARDELRDKLAADLSDRRTLIRCHWDKVRHGRREWDYLFFDGGSMTWEEIHQR